MKTTYTTKILGFGNHASIEIPEKNLSELGGNKRAPLKITLNNYAYQSTATVMGGVCMVVFPTKDRNASGIQSGDEVLVTLELDEGYREVEIPKELISALAKNKLDEIFHDLTYSKRKEFARQVSDAKTPETKTRRIEKVITELQKL